MTSSTPTSDAVDPSGRKPERSSLWAISLVFAMVTILFNMAAIVVFLERHKVFSEREMSVSVAETQIRAERADLDARIAAHRNLQNDFAKTQEDLGKSNAMLVDLNRQLASKEAELQTLENAREDHPPTSSLSSFSSAHYQ